MGKMWGLNPVTAQTLMILAAAAGRDGAAAPACTQPAPTEISVVPRSREVRIDASKSFAEMQGFRSDTLDPYSFHGLSTTQGLMQGSIKMEYRPALDYAVDRESGTACLWYDSIDVTFTLAPTILIAGEVYKDECMREAVLDHEMKHVMTDRRAVNKYAKVIGEKLMAEIGGRGFIAGPVPVERAQEVANRMNRTVKQIIEHEYKKMNIERTEAQRALDTKAEYDATNAKCPDFANPLLERQQKKR